MIDDLREVKRLLSDMQAHLPIPAYPTPELLEVLRGGGMVVFPDQEMQVDSVLYLGDEGGIACAVQHPATRRQVVMASITHLRFDRRHPLAGRISAYQVKRSSKIAKKDAGPKRTALRQSAARDRKRRRKKTVSGKPNPPLAPPWQ